MTCASGSKEMWVGDDLSKHPNISRMVDSHYLADSKSTATSQKKEQALHTDKNTPYVQGTAIMTCASGSKEMWVSDDLSEHPTISRRVHSHYLADSE
jgi:hypothetical protein